MEASNSHKSPRSWAVAIPHPVSTFPHQAVTSPRRVPMSCIAIITLQVCRPRRHLEAVGLRSNGISPAHLSKHNSSHQPIRLKWNLTAICAARCLIPLWQVWRLLSPPSKRIRTTIDVVALAQTSLSKCPVPLLHLRAKYRAAS